MVQEVVHVLTEKEGLNETLQSLLAVKHMSQSGIQILNQLNEPVIDLDKLKLLMFKSGVPDEINGLRPVVWQLLLGSLPLEPQQWE